MAVRDGTVWFDAYSETSTTVDFSARVPLTPTRTAERGDLIGRRTERRWKYAFWSYEVAMTDDMTEPMNDALAALVSRLEPHADALAELADDWTYEIRCWGSSDSTQGGFWIDQDTFARVAALGAAFCCTVYLDEPEEQT